MNADATTEWALGMGGWWRRERGAALRVRTRSLPPRDEDAVWTCEVDLRGLEEGLGRSKCATCGHEYSLDDGDGAA